MSGPITDCELGRRLHQEYEAEASLYWGKVPARSQKPILPARHKVALVLSRAVVFVGIIVGALACWLRVGMVKNNELTNRSRPGFDPLSAPDQ